MRTYEIKKCNKDFKFTNEINNKGTRPKRIAIDSRGRKAIFKYQMYNCSEACSEKLSCEFAKALGYKCADIEFALDSENKLGILNYLFVDVEKQEHTDAIAYIKKENEDRKEFYTLDNVKKCLDKLNLDLFKEFIRIMVFDALIGEQDRHEENWGIIVENGKYRLSPLYDNGYNLLCEFYDESYAEKYYSGVKDFVSYIKRSKASIYNKKGTRYGHFELIEELYKIYPCETEKEINNLVKLSENKISEIVNKVPNEIITKTHKEYIIKYVINRKNILIGIINKGSD